jgi:hypothetical protein
MQKFVDLSANDQIRYNREYERYAAFLPPSRPRGSYAFFVTESYPRFRDQGFANATRQLAQLWKSLNAEQRQPYLAKAAEKEKIYRTNIDAYRAVQWESLFKEERATKTK